MDSDVDPAELEAVDRAEREYTERQARQQNFGVTHQRNSTRIIDVHRAPHSHGEYGSEGSFLSKRVGIKRNREIGRLYKVQEVYHSGQRQSGNFQGVNNGFGGFINSSTATNSGPVQMGMSGNSSHGPSWESQSGLSRNSSGWGAPGLTQQHATPTGMSSGSHRARLTASRPSLKALYTASISLAPGGKCVIEYSGYHEELVGLMASIPGASMDRRLSTCTVGVEHYENVVETLRTADQTLQTVQLKILELGKVPQDIMLAASKLPDDSDRYSRLPEELESRLYQYQREGVKFGLKHGGRILIGDEMGLGKTTQALAIAVCYREKWPVLVVTTSGLRAQWSNGISEWLHIPHNQIKTLDHTCPPEVYGVAFVVASYEGVSKAVDKLKGKYAFVILDESHMIKNPKSVRSKACVSLAQKSQHVVLLSGTPATSRPFELFAQIKALLPRANLTQNEFCDRYCTVLLLEGDYFSKSTGSKNEEELNLLLCSTIMVRRLKARVAPELGSKNRQQVYISLKTEERDRLRSLKRKLDDMRDVEDVMETMPPSQTTIGMQKKVMLNELFHESAKAKREPVQKYISNVLNMEGKMLIFAHHKEMLDAIEQVVNRNNTKYIRIDGSTNPAKRDEYKIQFQEDITLRVAILAIKAAGVGLNFTAARLVIFAELSWVPGDIKQCEDRAHRIGQEHAVSIRFLLARDSIDDIIWRTIQNKLGNVGQVLDGDQEVLHVNRKHEVGKGHGMARLDKFLTQTRYVPENQLSQRKPSVMTFSGGSKRGKPDEQTGWHHRSF